MIGTRVSLKRSAKDEAEKPFWISFADLMTALMVLFLVVMGVALLAVTKNVTEREKKEQQHRKEIEIILDRFEAAAEKHKDDGVRVDRQRQVIDFGQRALFAFGRSNLEKNQEEVLRRFVPEILKLSNDELGKRVLKRLVVEGYTDKRGTYLSNLNLSLQRSQRVLCSMFAVRGEALLTESEKEQVRSLFLVGGYSFNAAKEKDEESRRVEMRLEFLGVDESRQEVPQLPGNFGECALS